MITTMQTFLRWPFVVLLSALLLVVACTQSAGTPTSTPIPTSTATQVPPTASPMPRPSPTPTPTATPVATPLATLTATATATSKPPATATATATPPPVPTPTLVPTVASPRADPEDPRVIYACQCYSAADPDCAAGDDANDGTTAETPWRTYEKARAEFGDLSAGDEIRFCRGGAFDLTSSGDEWVNPHCTAANPCLVSDYTPSWASSDQGRPIFWKSGEGHVFSLANGGNPEHQEGYVFENLDLRCPDCEDTVSWGFLLYNDVDDVVISNVRMDGFNIGVHLAGSNPCSADPQCDERNERLTLQNCTIINSQSQGFLGSGNGLVIENCYFENNGSIPIFDHNIYLARAQGDVTDIRVSGNELYRAAIVDGRCAGVSLVAHGTISNLVIENNLVWEDVGGASPGCWGISVDPAYFEAERFENIQIRGNTVINVGNLGIGVGSCIGCLIENNVVINEQEFEYGVTAIRVPVRTPGPGDAATTEATVRNNSIYVTNAGTGIQVDSEGSGHTIVSNAIRYTGTNRDWSCLEADLPASSYVVIDYNVCGFSSGTWERRVGQLSDWQALAWSTHSQAADPGFVSSSDLSAASESAAIVDAGHPTLSFAADIEGDPRGSTPDAGAYELAVPPIPVPTAS